MVQFLVAYNQGALITGESAGEWILVDAKDKSDALSKVLDIPVPGLPRSTVLDESPFIYIVEIKPEDRTDLQ